MLIAAIIKTSVRSKRYKNKSLLMALTSFDVIVLAVYLVLRKLMVNELSLNTLVC